VSKVFRNIIGCVLSVFVLFAVTGCSSNNAYIPSLKQAEVQSPTISEDGVLKVGVNASKSPLAGNGNNTIIGIDVDIAAALADELGLKVEIIDVESDFAAALANGTIDIAFGVDASDSNSDLWTSDIYLPSCASLFTLDSSTLSAPTVDSSIRVAAQVSSKSAWAVSNLFGDSTLVSRADLSSALDALTTGTTDYLAADAVIGMYAANRAGTSVKLVATLEAQSGYCVSALIDNTELQSSVSSALSKLISNGTINLIQTKWLGSTVDLDSASNLALTTSSSSVSTVLSTDDEDEADDAEIDLEDAGSLED
jgi:polar amino acid transport system substrate-binding protein